MGWDWKTPPRLDSSDFRDEDGVLSGDCVWFRERESQNNIIDLWNHVRSQVIYSTYGDVYTDITLHHIGCRIDRSFILRGLALPICSVLTSEQTQLCNIWNNDAINKDSKDVYFFH